MKKGNRYIKCGIIIIGLIFLSYQCLVYYNIFNHKKKFANNGVLIEEIIGNIKALKSIKAIEQIGDSNTFQILVKNDSISRLDFVNKDSIDFQYFSLEGKNIVESCHIGSYITSFSKERAGISISMNNESYYYSFEKMNNMDKYTINENWKILGRTELEVVIFKLCRIL